MKTHTPGPWIVDYHPDDRDSKHSILSILDGSNESLSHPQGPLTIARLNVSAFAPHMDEPMANARLITAAPDLLLALERLVHPMADDEDLSFARDCIANARGK